MPYSVNRYKRIFGVLKGLNPQHIADRTLVPLAFQRHCFAFHLWLELHCIALKLNFNFTEHFLPRSCIGVKIISIDMKGRSVSAKTSCHARSIPGRLRCCQTPIQKFAKYRAIFVSFQMLAKYCGAIFGRLWF